MAKYPSDPIKRFWKHVEKTDGCWIWKGMKDPKKYIVFKIGNKNWRGHRFSFTIHKGPIPEGLQVCHSCDNRCCVRPDHLFLGTNMDNFLDCRAKGRAHFQRRLPRICMGGETSTNAKLTWTQVREMRELRKAGLSIGQLKKLFPVAYQTVQAVCAGKTWKEAADANP